jgi:hypothetical protein
MFTATANKQSLLVGSYESEECLLLYTEQSPAGYQHKDMYH